ncbi:MAG: hypothetical protein IJD01_00945 [Clostridia bacterium]|nr:hypothetical protein [Clostridia bacterium]
MAVFTNQATISYNGVTANSNIAYGEILDVLSVTKTAVETGYTADGVVTYVVTLRNTGSVPLTALTVTDDLGGYPFGTDTVYPLTYVADSATVFADGVPQAAPSVTVGPPLTVTGFTVPANGDTVLVYQARTNAFAPPEGEIVNTVTVTGSGLTAPLTASETVSADSEAAITIFKTISPSQVVENDTVAYTFRLDNSGTAPLSATDNAVIRDTFDPILTGLTVTFNGTPWTEGVEYTYDETTGLFTTTAGAVTVPAATYTQDPVTGAYTVTPGSALLVVTGVI